MCCTIEALSPHCYATSQERKSVVHLQQSAALHVDRVEEGRIQSHEGHLDSEPIVEAQQPAAAEQQPRLT